MSRLGRTFKTGRANTPSFYHPTSFFNRPLGPNDVASADQTPAQHLANQMLYGAQSGYTFQGYSGIGYGNAQYPFSMGFNGPNKFSHPVFCVRPSVAAQNISIQTVGGLDGFSPPAKWFAGEYFNLQSKLNAVPIPDKTLCPRITGTGDLADIWAGGTDQSCFIWNLDTDEGYEFWELNNSTSSPSSSSIAGTNWTCHYGGYIPSVSKFSGVFPNNWGSRGSSIGEAGGLITYQDIVNAYHGEPMCHAISIACPMNGGTTQHVLPATRGDGPGPNGNNVPTIPNGFPGAGGANPAFQHDVTKEAQRFRLDPAYNINIVGITQYPLAYALAYAAQNYGLYITDTSGAVAFYLEDARTFGSPYYQYGPNAVDPFSLNWNLVQNGADPRFGALPSGRAVMHVIDWSRLQVLDPISS